MDNTIQTQSTLLRIALFPYSIARFAILNGAPTTGLVYGRHINILVIRFPSTDPLVQGGADTAGHRSLPIRQRRPSANATLAVA